MTEYQHVNQELDTLSSKKRKVKDLGEFLQPHGMTGSGTPSYLQLARISDGLGTTHVEMGAF